MSKLKKYAKKGEPHPVDKITCEEAKRQILSTLKAIEVYILCSSIAIGLLQIMSLKFSEDRNKTSFRFLRTKSNAIVSEATVACYLRKNIFSFISKTNKFSISRIIKNKQVEPLFHEKLLVS